MEIGKEATGSPAAVGGYGWYGVGRGAAVVAEFSILGPFEVVAEGHAVRLGGPKQAALLAVLLLGRGEVQSSDRLIDLLWGERPPATAAKTLQVYVSNLRKLIGPEAIETSGRGYRLVVAAEDLDADRFEALASQGRRALSEGDAATARGLMGSALSLWRGEPLADFAYAPFAQPEIVRLGEARLAAVEGRIEADLALGNHAQVVAELEGLVTRHPARERLLGLLMLALYRSDRQVEALEVFRHGRQALADELGLEPGPKLRELEQAILRHDQALAAPRSSAPIARSVRGPVIRGGALIAVGGLILLAAAVTAIAVVISRGSSSPGPIGNTVVAIDARTDQLVGRADVGAEPGAVGFADGSIWVANVEDQTVSQVDPRSLQAVRTLAIGATPTAIATTPGAVWVTTTSPNATSVEIHRINPQFDTIAAPIRVGNAVPGGGGSIAASGQTIWVAPSNGELAEIDAGSGTVVRKLDPNVAPNGIAIGNGAVWATGGDADNVMRLDPSGLQTAIPVDRRPTAVAAGAGAIWTIDPQDGTLVRIDPSTNASTNTVPVGTLPAGIAIGAGSVWVANSGDGTVTRIDPQTDRVIATIAVGGSPQAITIAEGRAWVTVDATGVKPAAPAQGGVLRVDFLGADIDSMDPALAYNGVSWELLQATCAKLLNYPDRAGAAGSQLIPEVAQSLPVRSAGGRTYTFTIRPGFRFSPPSNAPVTAETFKYTIERSLNPKMSSPFDYQFGDIVGARAYMAGKAAHIAGVIATGDKLIIRLTTPHPDLPTRVAQSVFCAVPIGTPIDPKGLPTIPMAGPYYIASYAPGQGVVLKRNPNYHGSRPHNFDQIDLAVNVPPNRGRAEILAGKADYTPDASQDSPSDARLDAQYGPHSRAAAQGKQQYFITPLQQLWFFDLNTRRPLFSDVRMRQAVNYAVDRTALTDVGGFGAGVPPPVPTDQMLPPGMPGYDDVSVYPLTADPSKARQLAHGKHGTAVLYTCNESECIGQAQVVKTDLARIGITVIVKEFPFQNLYPVIKRPGSWDMALFGWQIDYPDPADFLNLLLEYGTQLPTFNDPAWRKRLANAATLTGPERYLTYGELATDLDRNAAPWIAWGNQTVRALFSARIGCQIDGIDNIDLAALCIRPSREK